MSKPVADHGEIIDHLTRSWSTAGYDVAWEGNSVSYTISYLPAASGGHEEPGWQAMTDVMQDAAREAFELWDDLIAIDLVETPSNASADISFNYSSTTGGSTYAQPYGFFDGTRADVRLTNVDIWFAHDWWTHDDDTDFYNGGYGIATYIHEIGHSLGFSHPGHYNGSASFEADAEYYQDTRQYTTMSYFNAGENGETTDHVGENGISRRYSSTPLLHDILALQSLYGADTATRTGNTTYGFNSNAGRSAYDFAQTIDPVIAIWDAGGVDTIDVSGWNTNQTVILSAGAFSSVGHMTNNLAIAFGATIENAVGGGGDDTLLGNSAANRLEGNAGADTLRGGAGEDFLIGRTGIDTLDGGADADTFYFGASDEGATVVDFESIDRLLFGSASLAAAVFATAHQVGANTVMTLNGTALTLNGISLSALDRNGDEIGFIGGSSGEPPATNDTYTYAKADGDIAITSAEETAASGVNDRVIFTDLTVSEVEVTETAGTLRFAWSEGAASGSLSVSDSGQYIEHYEFADGTEFDAVTRANDAGGTTTASGGDDLVIGGAGKDILYSGAGNDWLDAGAGTGTFQYLRGQDGDDTYAYSKASGKVYISASAETATGGTADRVLFEDLSARDVTFGIYDYTATSYGAGEGKALQVLWDDGAGSGELRVAQGGQHIESFEFADGTAFNTVTLLDDSGGNAYGTSGNDIIIGGAGKDIVDAGDGADWLDAGGATAAFQYLRGQGGDDTYAYSKASGKVFITADAETATGGSDQVLFRDLGLSDVSFGVYDYTGGSLAAQGNALRVLWSDGADSGELRVALGGANIEHFEFADGITFDTTITTSAAGGNTSGTDGNDLIIGGAGTDLIMTGDGNDYLDAGIGGTAFQYLRGQHGDDTYSYAKASGRVFIAANGETATGGTDRLVFRDLNSTDVTADLFDYAGSGNPEQGEALLLLWDDGTASGEVRIALRGEHIEAYEFADGVVMTHDEFFT